MDTRLEKDAAILETMQMICAWSRATMPSSEQSPIKAIFNTDAINEGLKNKIMREGDFLVVLEMTPIYRDLIEMLPTFYSIDNSEGLNIRHHPARFIGRLHDNICEYDESYKRFYDLPAKFKKRIFERNAISVSKLALGDFILDLGDSRRATIAWYNEIKSYRSAKSLFNILREKYTIDDDFMASVRYTSLIFFGYLYYTQLLYPTGGHLIDFWGTTYEERSKFRVSESNTIGMSWTNFEVNTRPEIRIGQPPGEPPDPPPFPPPEPPKRPLRDMTLNGGLVVYLSRLANLISDLVSMRNRWYETRSYNISEYLRKKIDDAKREINVAMKRIRNLQLIQDVPDVEDPNIPNQANRREMEKLTRRYNHEFTDLDKMV
jgi:hypothetical protein